MPTAGRAERTLPHFIIGLQEFTSGRPGDGKFELHPQSFEKSQRLVLQIGYHLEAFGVSPRSISCRWVDVARRDGGQISP